MPKAPMLWLVRRLFLTLVLTSSNLPPASRCLVGPGPAGTSTSMQMAPLLLYSARDAMQLAFPL
eukprot:13124294-Heterocapsa_arctica.AAC.1